MSNQRYSMHRRAVPQRMASLGTTLSGLVLVLLGPACGARYELGDVEPPPVDVEPPLGDVDPPLGDDSTGGGGLAAVLVVDGAEDADAEVSGTYTNILPLGDVDGDGFADWMDFGQLVYGAPRPAQGLTLNSEKGPFFTLSGIGKIGYRTVGASDFNGDGYSDVLVRDPLGTNYVELLPDEPSPEDFEARKEREADYFRTVRQMQAFLWYGGPERSYGEHVLNDEAVGFRVTEDLTSSFRSLLAELGDDIVRYATYEVRPQAIGDIDGDGYGDLAVTAGFGWQTRRMNPEAMFGVEELDSGSELMTYVYYGRPERFELAALREPDARLAGVTLQPIGDVNGDGYGDVQATTTATTTTPASSHLIGGRAARLPAQPALGAISVPILGHDAEYGISDALGDIDGDGCDDFSLSHYLFYGSPSLLQGPVNLSASSAEIVTSDPLDPLYQLHAAGDWNGDGRSDLLILQTHQTAGGYYNQALSVIAGTSRRFSGRYEVPPFVPKLDSNWGLGMFALGADADGDGGADIFFGAGGGPTPPHPWHVKYGGLLTTTIH